MVDNLEKLAGEFPLKVTERALQHLVEQYKETKQEREATNAYMPDGIIIAVQGGGCSGFQYKVHIPEMEKDAPDIEENYILEVQGVKLYVDMMSTQYLKGTELDYVETLQGAGLAFRNPNAKRTCGCGSSFSG